MGSKPFGAGFELPLYQRAKCNSSVPASGVITPAYAQKEHEQEKEPQQ
jgi:hypothetical protein